MGIEQGEPAKEHEGEYYLRLLGLENLVGVEINVRGKTILARDFLELEGERERALPILKGFEAMDLADPNYETVRDGLQKFVSQHIEGLKLDR